MEGLARSLALVTVVAGAASVGGACASDPIEEPPVYDAHLRVGGAPASGEGFLDLEDYTPVDLVPGAQGGFHVWINVSVHGIEGDLVVEREARRVSDDRLVLRATPQALLVPGDAMDDWWQAPFAAPAFMCPTPIGISVIDEAIEVTVRLKDENDEVLAEDSVIVVPTCNLQADFCQSICSG